MKKILGLVLAVLALAAGLRGLNHKESSTATVPRSAFNGIVEGDTHSQPRAMYFTSTGTLTINGNNATFRAAPAR